MQNANLKNILNLIINEDMDKANVLLHQWFVEQTKAVHENMMQEDDMTSSIKDDQDAIDSEEFYGESDLGEDDDNEGDDDSAQVDADAASDVMSGDDDDAGLDDGTGDDASSVPSDVTTVSTDPTVIGDQFSDLQADLARLQKEFEMISGGGDASATDADADTDGMGTDSVPATDPSDDLASEGIMEDDGDDGEDDDGADSDSDSDDTDDDAGDDDDDAGGDDDLDESFFSDLDFDDIAEAVAMKPVKKPTMKDGKEVGAEGSVNTNKKSSLPQKSLSKRQGGDPVEIKNDEHNGFAREKAPSTKTNKTGENSKPCFKDGTSKVPAKGSSKATLNKTQGKVNDKSVISGESKKKGL